MTKIAWRTILIGATLISVLFLMLGTVSIVGWEYSNSNAFCSNACHQVHPQEPFAHQQSQHAEVDCVECHIGRMDFFDSAIEKTGHMTHVWSMLVGYDRPTHAKSLQSAENSCEGCHPKTTHRNNSLRVIEGFEEDRENSASKTTLTMRLVGRNFGEEESLGINWHASGAVKFMTDDAQAQDISMVQATLPDGTTRTYHDVTRQAQDQPLEGSEKLRTMDCLSCHNRVGHAFPNPSDVVDKALSSGSLDRNLPFIKKRVMKLLDQEVESEAHAKTLVAQAWKQYASDFPDITEEQTDTTQVALADPPGWIAELMVSSQHLESKSVDWTSFPDQNGHRDAPGCFRCHNGKLQTAAGRPIPVNCTNCHSIPLVTRDDKVPAYYQEILDVRVPDYHADPAFMSVHMDLAEDSCSSCHGDIEYGDDDQSHCSNSGCHSETWEYLDFEALRMSGSLPTNDN